jgi:hypothetical protein
VKSETPPVHSLGRRGFSSADYRSRLLEPAVADGPFMRAAQRR